MVPGKANLTQRSDNAHTTGKMALGSRRIDRLWRFATAAGAVVRSRCATHRPFFISHLITTRCFARCATCLWRGQSDEQFDTSKIIDFYSQARALGFLATTMWGGEPLLRQDLDVILKHCHRIGLTVGVITNGYLLPDQASLLSQYLDFLIVSIDLPDQRHDELRGVPGLFDRALKGIDLVRHYNPRTKIFINSVISVLNDHAIEALVQLAERLNISITFESVNQGPIEFPRDDKTMAENLRLPSGSEQYRFQQIRELKRQHRPVNNSFSYLNMFIQGQVRYRCHAPKISIRVESDGSVTNCQDRAHPIGNVYHEPLRAILQSPQMKILQDRAESCCRCVDSGVIESSLFWEFTPEVIANSLRLFLH